MARSRCRLRAVRSASFPRADGVAVASDLHLTRPWPEDTADIAAALGSWDVTRWLTAAPWPYGPADAAAFVANAGLDEYAVRTGDDLVGMVRAGQSFGIWIAPEWQRRGIGLRAAVLALTRRFVEGADLVEASHLEDNAASAALLARLGFRETGREVQWSQSNVRNMPAVQLTLTRADFAARHSLSLRTARLVIDGYRDQDLPDLHRIATDPCVAPMLLRFWPGMTHEEIAPIFATEALIPPLRLVARLDGRVIGSVGISAGDPPSIFYFLAPDMAGQGFGQEMVTAFLDEVRARYDLPQIKAEVFLDNAPSRKLLKNLGFQRGQDQRIQSKGRSEPADATIYEWRRRALP